MAAEIKSIGYKIFFKQSQEMFEKVVEINEENFEHPAPELEELPKWSELDYKKCPNCTLNPIWHTHCPLAVRLIPLVNMPPCNSYDEVTAEVTMEGKKISVDTSAQEVLSSLLGLVMATSGCPHTQFFKPLAWYHQPFATPEETVYRACTAYLSSYALHNDSSNKVSFEALKKIYTNIHIINVNVASRIHNYAETDSAINAIVLLDLITQDLPIAVDEDLSELKRLFKHHRSLFGANFSI